MSTLDLSGVDAGAKRLPRAATTWSYHERDHRSAEYTASTPPEGGRWRVCREGYFLAALPDEREMLRFLDWCVSNDAWVAAGLEALAEGDDEMFFSVLAEARRYAQEPEP